MKIKRVSGEVEKVDSLVAPKELRWIINDSLPQHLCDEVDATQ